MNNAFERSLQFTLKWEGSAYVDDPQDPGGATNYGISLRFLQDLAISDSDINADGVLNWRDVAELTPAKAADLYRRYFWGPLCCDEMPDRLACALFDAGVNVGRSRAAKWLQHLVGSARDGVIGSKTLARLDGICPRPDLATESDHGPAEWALVIALNAMRAKHYYRLAVEEDWARRFLRGWISRADDLEKELAGWEA